MRFEPQCLTPVVFSTEAVTQSSAVNSRISDDKRTAAMAPAEAEFRSTNLVFGPWSAHRCSSLLLPEAWAAVQARQAGQPWFVELQFSQT
jgi:hypothetical protein